jgi:hypothetical protein
LTDEAAVDDAGGVGGIGTPEAGVGDVEDTGLLFGGETQPAESRSRNTTAITVPVTTRERISIEMVHLVNI